MRDFLATMLSLAIIFGTIWGVVLLFIFSIDFIASVGIPRELLYFTGGVAFAATYKKVGGWFMNYCNIVWEKLHDWIVWR